MELMQPLPPFWGDKLRMALEWAATLAFALSGVIEAARKRLDAVGVCVVAFATAFGGGTLRDLLLDQRPFFWVRHVEFLWALLGLCVAAVLFMRQRHLAPTERAILWPDALGLGLFTAVGVDLALAVGEPPLVAVLMGVVTSVFGGVLRDVLADEPSILLKREIYVTAALAGAMAYVCLTLIGVAAWPAALAGFATAGVVRGGAIVFGWSLPPFGGATER